MKIQNFSEIFAEKMKIQQFLFWYGFFLVSSPMSSPGRQRLRLLPRGLSAQPAFRGADQSRRSAGASKSWLEDVGGSQGSNIWVWKNRPFLWINENLSTKMPSKVEIDVSKNRVYPQIIHFNRGFPFIIHPFWGTPIFGNTRLQVFRYSHHSRKLGGGNSNIFYFHAPSWGRWTHFY